MKSLISILSGLVLVLSGCSTASYMTDDVYYAPGDEVYIQKQLAKTGVKTKKDSQAKARNENFNAQTYSEPENGLEVVDNGDTLALDSFEYENGDRDVVVNNYYSDYASRLNHFYGPSAGDRKSVV